MGGSAPGGQRRLGPTQLRGADLAGEVMVGIDRDFFLMNLGPL